MSLDHDKMSRDHDKMSRDHDEMSRDHDKMSRDHDEMSRDHDEMSRDHDEMSRDHDNSKAGNYIWTWNWLLVMYQVAASLRIVIYKVKQAQFGSANQVFNNMTICGTHKFLQSTNSLRNQTENIKTPHVDSCQRTSVSVNINVKHSRVLQRP